MPFKGVAELVSFFRFSSLYWSSSNTAQYRIEKSVVYPSKKGLKDKRENSDSVRLSFSVPQELLELQNKQRFTAKDREVVLLYQRQIQELLSREYNVLQQIQIVMRNAVQHQSWWFFFYVFELYVHKRTFYYRTCHKKFMLIALKYDDVYSLKLYLTNN